MITRLHSHPGPLCRFLFSCSMPSSPPLSPLYRLSLSLSFFPVLYSSLTLSLFLSPLFCRIRLALLVVLYPSRSLARSRSNIIVEILSYLSCTCIMHSGKRQTRIRRVKTPFFFISITRHFCKIESRDTSGLHTQDVAV